jgi:exonuclease SbcC
MITKVKLKNWRSHLDSEFNFSSGTNALIGIMGSGKTSVLDSICFALFGTFPTLQSKKLKLEDIIMKKPVEKDRSEVELQFQLNGNNYSIKRIIEKRKGTTHSELRENGKLIEAPNSQRVTETVEKILKVNYELFSKAIYSEQNALDYFLTIPKGQRMKKIDELLMIDKFEKARANTVTLTNRLVERKLAIQNVVDQTDIAELEKNISFLKSSLDQMLMEKESLKKNFDEISGEKVELEKEVSEMQKIRESLELLKREEKGISAAIEETRSSLKALGESLKDQSKEVIQRNIFELKGKIENLEKNLKERQGSYENIASQIAKSKARLDFLEKEKIEKLEKEIEEKLKIKKDFEHLKGIVGGDVVRQLDEKHNLHERLIGEVQELKAKIKDLDEVIQQLSALEGKCPVCESSLTEERKNLLIEQKQQQINALKERLESASKNKELNEQELKKLEEAAKKLDEMLIEIRDFDVKRTDLEDSKKLFTELAEVTIKTDSQLLQLRNEIGNIGSQLKESVERKQTFEILSMQQKEYGEKLDRFNELMQQRIHFEEEIKAVEARIFGKDLSEMENRLKALIAKEKEVETKIFSFDQLAKEKELRMKEHDAKLEEVEKQKEEVRRLDKLIKELKIFEKALELTQVELRTEFIEAVNYSMNKLWPTLYPYQDFIGVKLAVEEGDYVLQLREKTGRMVNADGVASGGERSIACLALRIAFALTLAPNLQMLVLDEPTANLDAKSIVELATTLRERINEFIGQTFLITHQAELEDAVTGNAYRLERDKTKDEVTKVISIS